MEFFCSQFSRLLKKCRKYLSPISFLHKFRSYVDPCFQSGGIGKKLIEHAISTFDADHLWALEKNTRAIAFYHRHGFMENGEKELEEGTTEYIAKLIRVEENVQLDEKPMHRKIMREEV